jgi:hypothetical protein
VTDIGNVISFPRQLRVVPFPDAKPETVPAEPPAVVDHDGRSYLLEDLLRGLSQDELQTVDQSAPRSGQELWTRWCVAGRRWRRRSWPGCRRPILTGGGRRFRAPGDRSGWQRQSDLHDSTAPSVACWSREIRHADANARADYAAADPDARRAPTRGRSSAHARERTPKRPTPRAGADGDVAAPQDRGCARALVLAV